jgi:hypothetical protein
MRWTIAGAEAVLEMRSIQINGMNSDYWQCHIAQEKQRLYGNFIENEMMEWQPKVFQLFGYTPI